ncbi:hypothetical protein LOTGIDRAFT_160344 [Lottia gigantea]|uniref:Uncharacterized protein n=1 Tax=Lottia gigantea TaxID=225164 RepID=V4AFW5_LOTGI|nr:hypothetical protein LOTGIDRAFT_160344 [Lottia gigantea]ESO95797.1 hypothetical protein LOTGIDRAFT_160344 [Lottia gigantea]
MTDSDRDTHQVPRGNKATFALCMVMVVAFFLLQQPNYHYFTMKHDIGINIESQAIKQTETLKQLEIVVTFPYMLDPTFKLIAHGARNETDKMQRMEEYMTCLKFTLNHRFISRVHLLYDQPSIVRYIISRLDHSIRNKITFQLVKDAVISLTAFEYVFSNLQGRLVMMMQADNYPGDGFNLVDKNLLREKKLMYALTRHGQLESACDMRKEKSSNTCAKGKYHGSHDGYIFVPNGNLPTNATKIMNVKSYKFGIDNLIIWMFKNVLNYKVLNPCKIIHIFHVHCSGVRNRDNIKRVSKGRHGLQPPTDKLF